MRVRLHGLDRSLHVSLEAITAIHIGWESGVPMHNVSAAEASRGALESLSRMMVKPEPSSDGTLEGLVREMLRPMLREWLDAHLPEMVEAMVAKEIARITREGR